MGTLALGRADQQTARTAFEESARLGHLLGDLRLEAWPLSMLAFQAFMLGDHPRGRALADRTYALSVAANDEVMLIRATALAGSSRRCRVLHLMGWLALLARDTGQASALEREALGLLWTLGDRRTVADCLEVLACAAAGSGPPERVAWLFGVTAHLRRTTSGGRPPYLDGECDRARKAVRTLLGSSTFDAHWSAGYGCSPEQAIGDLLTALAASPDEGTTASRGGTTGAGGDGHRGPVRLTRREAQIAQLVVRGMTNRQIAAELAISERTAERHLENVRVKLRVTSRAQIAAWAVRHGSAEPGRS